ncbi:MAG: tyrosine-type recombinase/integrase [Lachnospiraceae bacterium]|nr:tyrosine-type recombinase/integrase [Lachnospiraceae bacterium]
MKCILNERILKDFREHLVLSEKTPATIDKYCRDVRTFAEYTAGLEITKEIMIAYKEKLREDGYAVRSINSMLASINSLLSYLGWINLRVKTLKVQQQVFCPEEKELTRAEYERLVKTSIALHNERLSLILQTICSTGIRVSELKYITVEAVKRGEAEVSCKNKIRNVFIVRDLQRKLLKYIARHGIESGNVFITRTGKLLSRTNIWRDMKSLCSEAGVCPNKVFPHNLRHLFARVFYGMDKDIAKLADILGHSNINTTRIYIISTGQEHRRRMESMKLVI